MFPSINPTTTIAWKELKKHQSRLEKSNLKSLFINNKERFQNFSIRFEDLLFDFSKNFIDEQSFKSLLKLASECGLDDAKDAIFSGQSINITENRAVLHHALRNVGDLPIEYRNKDVMPEVNAALNKIKNFSQSCISGEWKGYKGEAITDVVNIGIGGSDLGPVMVVEALKNFKSRLNLHFVSNVDPSHLGETLKRLNPATTLFVIASKTFTTQETIANANAAKKWILAASEKPSSIEKHFVAVSTNSKLVKRFGINLSNMFEFNDWVGGRFSLWSSIGLSIALAVGFENFEELLEGAFVMDLHFKYAQPERNIPLIMALLGVWYANFWDFKTQAILPYSQYLSRFPAYLQQAEMESNGKSVNRSGKRIDYATCPVVWGEPGTNGQHAFYQLLHQGTQTIPADFIAFAQSSFDDEMNEMLLANFFAQTEALMNGKSKAEAKQELEKLGLKSSEINKLLPFKVFEGNKPTTSFLFKKLCPRSLGSLIAAYEHKIFVQGVIWNVFSYDQWGVELGKQLAGNILPEIKKGEIITSHDTSTNGLINFYLDQKA